MNGAHLHLMLNHLPVVGAFFSILLLVIATFMKNETLRTLAVALVLFIGVLGLPAYFTGEEAEKTLEAIGHANEQLIEVHEDAAGRAIVSLVFTSTIALFVLGYYFFKKMIPNWCLILLLVTMSASLGLISWTAWQGGKISHPEIRGETLE